MKNKMIALLMIMGVWCLSTSVVAYVMLPYQQMGYDYFELFLRYDTTTFATNSDANTDLVAFGYVGLDFSYRNLAYNLRIIPVTLEDADSETVDEISWTVHNIHWQLFQDFDYGIFKHLRPGGQVGVTNLGLPRTSLSENTALANYLSSYYFSLEMHLFNNPRINVYYGMNFNSEVDMNSDLYIIEYEYNKNKIYYENAYDASYVGLVLYLSEYRFFELAINISGDIETNILDSDGNFIVDENGEVSVVFNPTYSVSMHMQNPLQHYKKKKAEKPLPVDEWSYIEMEKALLTFYDEDYKTSLLHYENVVEKYPNFGLVHLRLGNTYFQLENFTLAKYHWQKALLYEVSNPEEIVYYLKKLEAKELEIHLNTPDE